VINGGPGVYPLPAFDPDCATSTGTSRRAWRFTSTNTRCPTSHHWPCCFGSSTTASRTDLRAMSPVPIRVSAMQVGYDKSVKRLNDAAIRAIKLGDIRNFWFAQVQW